MVVVLAEVAEIVLTDFSLSHETSIYSETSCVQNQKSSKITFSNCVHRLRHVINYILVCVDMNFFDVLTFSKCVLLWITRCCVRLTTRREGL